MMRTLRWWGEDVLPSKMNTEELPADRDGRLVTLARHDASEFVHLVRLYERRVFATALRLVGNTADAEEVSQEAFLKAYRALDRFEIGRAFGPWVCVIASNVAKDRLRGPFRRFIPKGLIDYFEEPSAKPADQVVAREEAATLEQAILKLSPNLREAVVLRFVSDMSVEEVAQALHIGESAAKMRLKRGLEQLRVILGETAPLPDEK